MNETPLTEEELVELEAKARATLATEFGPEPPEYGWAEAVLRLLATLRAKTEDK